MTNLGGVGPLDSYDFKIKPIWWQTHVGEKKGSQVTWGKKRAPGWWGYIGDYTTQLYRA